MLIHFVNREAIELDNYALGEIGKPVSWRIPSLDVKSAQGISLIAGIGQT